MPTGTQGIVRSGFGNQTPAAMNARPPTSEERSAMAELVAKFDNAKRAQDYDALMGTFHPNAVCEFKPAGVRITSFNSIAEMYRRTLPSPKLSTLFMARRKVRDWSNQNGLLRDWLYPDPVKLPSGAEKPARELEIIEFADGLKLIMSYRVRTNLTCSALFVEALGKDYLSLPGR